ncbi:MAG: hypothetical protein HKP57_08325 [Halobacteria archaeon]|nr:hypothetical protein [Halobacteria archaeon]
MADRLSVSEAGPSAMEQGESAKCWYARRDGVVRGPFSASEVTRYILLGRISLDDDVSDDRKTWRNLKTVAAMLPPELNQLSSWEDYQRLIIARMQVDERKPDRRTADPVIERMPDSERRAGDDRRSEEGGLSLARYFFAASESIKPARVRNYRLGTLVLTVMLAVLVVAWLVPAGS